jgi:hypothetical protein
VSKDPYPYPDPIHDVLFVWTVFVMVSGVEISLPVVMFFTVDVLTRGFLRLPRVLLVVHRFDPNPNHLNVRF